MFHVMRVAAGFFILCLAADTLASVTFGPNHQQSSAVAQPTASSPPTPANQDNQLQSTVTSYKSVVIHHQYPNHAITSRQASNSTSEQDAKQDQKKEASRSEMYFTMHNSHSKPRQPEEASQKPATAQETPKVQRSPDQIRITRFEGDFRPMTSFREPETPRRPQRLTSPSYTSIESDESFGSDEVPSNYRGPGSEEEYTPRYEKLTSEKSKYEHPSPEVPYRTDEPKRYYLHSPAKSNRGHPSFTRSPPIKTYKAKMPPPGMTEELMDTLLQQEPQTFDPEKQKRAEQKKKYKPSDSPTTFNVGYSIGFGRPPSDDIVVGRPKDVKLHVNGQSSVWKQLNDNIEMSQDVEKLKEPVSFRVSDSAPRTGPPKFNILNNNGQSVFYLNKDSPTIDTVPTAGRISFDHNRALTHSNLFDVSNAVAPPMAIPLQSNFIPEHHHTAAATPRPKARELDIMSLYQSMGYSAPVPVLLPGSKGEAQMVHAIVIPIQSMPQFDYNWPRFAAMYSHHSPAVIAAPSLIPAFPTHEAAFANVITQLPTQHSPLQSTRPPFLPTPNTHYNHPQSSRSPKSNRKPKDVAKFSATFSSPIVVAPTKTSLRQDLRKEQATLNAILAQELSRKNRHMPLGLRPPQIKSSQN